MTSTDASDGADLLSAKRKPQVTREDLYDEVWREPMLTVAKRHGVSSSFLARVCTSMNVPRPARGYWAKLEFGKAEPQPPLPEARPGDKLVWNRSDDPDIVSLPPPKPPVVPRMARPVKLLPTKRHALIVGARELFTKGRTSDVGLLKPSKKLLVDLVVSEKVLDTALDTANQLFQHFEAAGHRVMLAPNDRHYRRHEVEEREVPRKGYHHANLWWPYRPKSAGPPFRSGRGRRGMTTRPGAFVSRRTARTAWRRGHASGGRPPARS